MRFINVILKPSVHYIRNVLVGCLNNKNGPRKLFMRAHHTTNVVHKRTLPNKCDSYCCDPSIV